MERENTGISIELLVTYLEQLGFIAQEPKANEYAPARYGLAVEPEIIALWAKDSLFVEDNFNTLFDKDGAIKDESEMLSFLKKYTLLCSDFPLSVIETPQVFLRAVLMLSPLNRASLVRWLLNKFPEDNFDPERPLLGDAILLMLRKIKDLDKYAKNRFKSLSEGRRTIYIVTPEYTCLAGGLGRVLQYLARALKEMGFDVWIVEPYYLYSKEVIEQKIPKENRRRIAYGELPLPLRVEREPAFVINETIQMKEETVNVFEARDDQDVGHLVLRDKRDFFTQILHHDGDGEEYPTKWQDWEFLTKAADRAIDCRESGLKKKYGSCWRPPVIFGQDGQAMGCALWPLALKRFQTPVLLEALWEGTTHTIFHRLHSKEIESF